MKHKKMFKRQKERHPIKWCAISLGLLMLSFASFGAGVQFATLTLEDSQVRMVDTEEGILVGQSKATSLRIAHKPG